MGVWGYVLVFFVGAFVGMLAMALAIVADEER